jgi:hypothetical protein
MLEIKRSGAKVAWHIVCNGAVIDVQPTKKQAVAVAQDMANKYGLEVAV